MVDFFGTPVAGNLRAVFAQMRRKALMSSCVVHTAVVYSRAKFQLNFGVVDSTPRNCARQRRNGPCVTSSCSALPSKADM